MTLSQVNFLNPTKMLFIFLLLVKIENIESKILLWSTEELKFPALKQYTTEDFQKITEKINNSHLIVFKTDLSKIPKTIREDLNLNSSYLPNEKINLKKFNQIEHNNDMEIIKEIYDLYENPLIVFEEKDLKKRKKRFTSRFTGVLYNSQGVMLYTDRPPVLRLESLFFVLDHCIGVRSDIHPRTIDLNIEFEIDKNVTILLEFKFILMFNNHWNMVTTKLADANGDNYLLSNINIVMKNNFSFHCSYDIRFRDLDNHMEVIFHGIQIQPNCEGGSFSPAAECTNYITPTTAASLIVGVLFVFGLFFGINAMLSIKTMDKFDNFEAKQLHLDDIRRN